MMKREQYDWKFASLSVLWITVLFLSFYFKKEIITYSKAVLTYPYLLHFAGIVSSVFMIVSKMKQGEININADMSFNEFKIPMEQVLSLLGNPVTLVGSLSLAKGILLQMSGEKTFFPFMQKWELVFITMVTAYLLFVSVMELIMNIKNVFIKDITINNKVKQT